MSARNPSSSSRFAGLKSYISLQNFRAVIPTRRALRPGEPGYVDGQTTTQSWTHWAHRKIIWNGLDATTVNEVTLFPGWASRCAHEHENEFELRVYVSGYATTRRSPEFLTRSQRAFLRLAKGYALLPKLQCQESPAKGASMIEIDGLKLPPRPDEIADDFEMELNKEFEHMRHTQAVQSSEDSYDSESDPQPSSLRDASAQLGSTLLQKQHRNLEARLRPFWSSALSCRTVQICIFVAPAAPDNIDSKLDTLQHDLLLTEHMVTGPDGAFANVFRIPWKKLQKTYLSSHRIFDKSDVEHKLLVSAKLLPQPTPTPAYTIPEDVPNTSLHIPITSSPICVITDIDDTVKHSNIPCGTRAVFHNVFVKDLEETTIPEMGTWYKSMWERGVRFHYVSNSPVELLPVIKEFLRTSELPLGSIRLKSYHSRSFFSGLLSGPATRKRANMVEVLDGFPSTKFILIGDSGEQDLELYASIASERPTQILAVFIRNVWDTGLANPTGSIARPITPSPVKTMSLPQTSVDHPHTLRTMSDSDTVTGSGADIDMIMQHPTNFVVLPQSVSLFDIRADSVTKPRKSMDSMSSTASSSSSSLSRRNLRKGTGQATLPITEVEKKRFELQIRVNKARLMMPSHVVLRVFRHPEECIETDWLLQLLKQE